MLCRVWTTVPVIVVVGPLDPRFSDGSSCDADTGLTSLADEGFEVAVVASV